MYFVFIYFVKSLHTFSNLGLMFIYLNARMIHANQSFWNWLEMDAIDAAQSAFKSEAVIIIKFELSRLTRKHESHLHRSCVEISRDVGVGQRRFYREGLQTGLYFQSRDSIFCFQKWRRGNNCNKSSPTSTEEFTPTMISVFVEILFGMFSDS